jgi:signal transduction histidine kinase
MTAPDQSRPGPGADLDALRAELAATAARLREAEASIAALNLELTETNQGVVALYAELDDNAVRLREASELKSRFLSYMSHEFRTPLGSIRSIARILTDRLDGPLTEEQAKQVQFIQTAATELSEMVNDLLDLAKVEAGRVTISPAWFEMVDLFSALRGMFKPILSSESVSLVFEEPGGIPPIYTDDKRLSQILRNFISNALKFTAEGTVRVSATLVDGWVTFAVADTGIGIAPEHLEALFEDFVQVEAPIQKRLRGTGLGLSLSRKLARLLGGDVAVTSAVGRGSVFSVTIPAQLPASTAPEPSRPAVVPRYSADER